MDPRAEASIWLEVRLAGPDDQHLFDLRGSLVLNAWEHVRVSLQSEEMLACPSMSEMTLTETPAATAKVAAVCRRSYNRMVRMPDAAGIRRNSFLTVRCRSGDPSCLQNTRSAHVSALPTSAPVRLERTTLNASRTNSCSFTTLRLRFRFVSPNAHAKFEYWMVRQTLTVPRVQSTSLHLSAGHSLGLIPVVRASAKSVNHAD